MLPNTPHAVRTYPGSAATALLPLTPANNYTATILMCGGTNLQPDVRSLPFMRDARAHALAAMGHDLEHRRLPCRSDLHLHHARRFGNVAR